MQINAPSKPWLKDLYEKTLVDDNLDGAAVLGFFLMLAIFPAMIFLLAAVAYLPIAHIDQAVLHLLHQALPGSAADMFTGVVHQITQERHGGILSFGIVAALWATSSGMQAIMQQINIVYSVSERRSFIRSRMVAIELSIILTIIVIGGLALIVLGAQIQTWLASRFFLSTGFGTLFTIFRWGILLVALLLAFSVIFYLAPNLRNRFQIFTFGSIVGVTVLLSASIAFGWYVKNFGNYSATYGSVGAVIVLMLWLYIAGLAILLGAEVNAVNARRAENKSLNSTQATREH